MRDLQAAEWTPLEWRGCFRFVVFPILTNITGNLASARLAGTYFPPGLHPPARLYQVDFPLGDRGKKLIFMVCPRQRAEAQTRCRSCLEEQRRAAGGDAELLVSS